MSRLHLHILGSGSKGNCALIEGPQGLIMIDDGLSRRETLKRMAELGLSADDVAALVITHEHTDHINWMEFSSRMNIPTTSKGSMYGASTGMVPSLPAGARFRAKKPSHIYP